MTHCISLTIDLNLFSCVITFLLKFINKIKLVFEPTESSVLQHEVGHCPSPGVNVIKKFVADDEAK